MPDQFTEVSRGGPREVCIYCGCIVLPFFQATHQTVCPAELDKKIKKIKP
jgi:hypothetical protein